LLCKAISRLLRRVAQQAGISKKAAAAAFNAVGEAITGELKKGRSVVISGFGTFKVSKRAARAGVNPRNPKEKIKIPALKVATFRAGNALKEAVRQAFSGAGRCRQKPLRSIRQRVFAVPFASRGCLTQRREQLRPNAPPQPPGHGGVAEEGDEFVLAVAGDR
jgi:DNA-binding protein HU-beta